MSLLEGTHAVVPHHEAGRYHRQRKPRLQQQGYARPLRETGNGHRVPDIAVRPPHDQPPRRVEGEGRSRALHGHQHTARQAQCTRGDENTPESRSTDGCHQWRDTERALDPEQADGDDHQKHGPEHGNLAERPWRDSIVGSHLVPDGTCGPPTGTPSSRFGARDAQRGGGRWNHEYHAEPCLPSQPGKRRAIKRSIQQRSARKCQHYYSARVAPMQEPGREQGSDDDTNEVSDPECQEHGVWRTGWAEPVARVRQQREYQPPPGDQDRLGDQVGDSKMNGIRWHTPMVTSFSDLDTTAKPTCTTTPHSNRCSRS